jgi:hypothetical protein
MKIKIFYNDGSEYKGDVKNEKPHGYGVMTYNDGSTYVGEWSEGKRHGHGTYSDPCLFDYDDSYSYTGQWKDDMMHGQGTIQYDNGRMLISEWWCGHLYGRLTLFRGDGTIEQQVDLNSMEDLEKENDLSNNDVPQESIFATNFDGGNK